MQRHAREPISLLVIVGPTAVGKTELAVEVAERLHGEIVAADSMQVYRGMDIGTAKPTPEQRARVRHHLIDIVEPEENYSVARYHEDATRAIEEIVSRERLPLLVGGTAFYIQAVVGGVTWPAVPPNPEVREALREQAKRDGAVALHARLRELSPVAAARLHPHDTQRVIRALEVVYANSSASTPAESSVNSGNRVSLDQTRSNRYNAAILGLTRRRATLYARIESRVDAMLVAGFLDEVRSLQNRGCNLQMTSMQGLGYRQALKYLAGELDFETFVSEWKRDTRHYAKRQLTWMRHRLSVAWVDLDACDFAQAVDVVVESARRIVYACDSGQTLSSARMCIPLAD